jgi:hypothetical protein
MKILFICGSLEPGRDGVGDYVRRLAAEIIRCGHQATIIALNEKHLKSSSIEKQYDGEIALQVLRIPTIWPANRRFDFAKDWIGDFNPEWISLQFVPYSFNNKGFSFGLGKRLKKIGGHCQWHIMFHELWAGRDENSDWKRYFVSGLQKLLIKRMTNCLSPSVIHTHLPVFYFKLKQFDWNIKKLPLFSNIEVTKATKNNDNKEIFRIGFFSQVEATEPIMSFLSILGKKASSMSLEVEILLIGGNEARMKQVGHAFETIKNLRKPVKYTGFLKNEELSVIIQSCTIGVTPIPRHGLGKSGSVAAFISHKIPVAALNCHFLYKATEIGFFDDDLCAAIITEPDFHQIEIAENAARIASDKIQLSKIAETFLSDLERSIISRN